MIRPAFHSALAVMLIGMAFFLFLFGLNGACAWLFGFSTAPVEKHWTALTAFFLLIAGGGLAAGVMGAHPNWSTGLRLSVAAAIVLVLWQYSKFHGFLG